VAAANQSDATILVLSDIHYAGIEEQARGRYETRIIANPLTRMAVHAYRHFIWKRNPFAHNHLLDRFLEQAGEPDFVVANGDYSCDSAFVGISDPAAYASAAECLGRLRARWGERLLAVMGDHELGKQSLVGRQGGLRLESLELARSGLGLTPFWQQEVGCYVLCGVTSSLLALPILESETFMEEREAWNRERECHLQSIRDAMERLATDQRLILFCHDPTALPFLWREPAVRRRLEQVDLTVIGHLHSNMILWQSRMLAGMPVIRFLGNAVRRMSAALREARYWRPFRVQLCPALSGLELLEDGGFGRIDLQLEGRRPPQYRICRWPRVSGGRGTAASRPGSGM
jgi:predicted MPP superfamily phosphohydrolase